MKRLLIAIATLCVFSACSDERSAATPMHTAASATGSTYPASTHDLKPSEQAQPMPTPAPKPSNDDNAVTDRVRGAINSDSALASAAKDIVITTKDRVVTLSGPVKTASQVKEAGEIAAHVTGVEAVNNMLKLGE